MHFNVKRLLHLSDENNASKHSEALEFVRIHDFLPHKLSGSERRNIIKRGAERAKRDFKDKYASLQEWFMKYDPLYLLSFCAFYYLSYPEGEDPEETGRLRFPPYFIEIMQAISLCNSRNYSVEPISRESEKLERDLNDIGSLLQLSLFTSLREDMTSEEMAAQEIRGDMILQTLAIRNWAYPHQMLRVVRDLCGSIDDKYNKTNRFKFLLFMNTINSILVEREELLNKHIEKVRVFIDKDDYREMINGYNRVFPENIPVKEDQIEEIWHQAEKNIEYLKSLLLFHSDLKIEKIYSFSLDHFMSLYKENVDKNVIRSFLDKLSFRFGELADYEKEYFLLDNPVHQRPFIKVDDENYFCGVFHILPDLMLGLLERLIGENKDLRIDYNDKIKSTYLENEVARLFKSHFPSATIFRGSLWFDPDSGKDYENDLTVILDTFAIIVECKSGSISAKAKRGASLSLFDKVRELVEEPSEQARRFIKYLGTNKKAHNFDTKRGIKNNIDSSRINYYVPVTVTLSSLGMIVSNLKKIVEAGVIKKSMSELAISISLTDLECVLDIFNYEAEYVHYFFRRREFDDHVDYAGDELDLLNFYLRNGFNIGECEFDKENSFMLINESKNLDSYFIAQGQNRKTDKPKHEITRWWEDILLRLSMKKPTNWVETSFILLNTTKGDQENFEKRMNELIKRIRRKKVEKEHNWVTFVVGPDRRKYWIVGYPYDIRDREERNAVIGTIIHSVDSDKIKGVVVIGIDLNRTDYPYSVLAGKLDTKLSSF